MKQHITLQQWDELSKEQKQILWDSGFKNDWKMNIGQMIEFLGDSFNGYFISDGKPKVQYWDGDDIDPKYFKGDELCNILWEKVKYKLKI